MANTQQFLMKGTDTNLSTTVFWSSGEPDLDGSEYSDTASLDVATIAVVRRRRLTPTTEQTFGLLEQDRDVVFAWRAQGTLMRPTGTFGVDPAPGGTVDTLVSGAYNGFPASQGTGDATWDADLEALTFNGSSSQYLLNDLSFFTEPHATGTFAVYFRVRWTTNNDFEYIAQSQGNRGWALYYDGNATINATQRLYFDVQNSVGTDLYLITHDFTPTVDTWYDILITGDGSNANMYVTDMSTAAATAAVSTEAGDHGTVTHLFSGSGDTDYFDGECQAIVLDDAHWNENTRNRWVRWGSKTQIPAIQFPSFKQSLEFPTLEDVYTSDLAEGSLWRIRGTDSVLGEYDVEGRIVNGQPSFSGLLPATALGGTWAAVATLDASVTLTFDAQGRPVLTHDGTATPTNVHQAVYLPEITLDGAVRYRSLLEIDTNGVSEANMTGQSLITTGDMYTAGNDALGVQATFNGTNWQQDFYKWANGTDSSLALTTYGTSPTDTSKFDGGVQVTHEIRFNQITQATTSPSGQARSVEQGGIEQVALDTSDFAVSGGNWGDYRLGTGTSLTLSPAFAIEGNTAITKSYTVKFLGLSILHTEEWLA